MSIFVNSWLYLVLMPYFVLASPDKCPIHSRQCVTLRLFFIQKYASLRSLQKYTKIFSGVILVVRCRCTPSIVAKLSVCCSSQLGIIQLLYPLMLHYRASLLPIISNVLRTSHRIYLPSVELMMFCRTLLRF